MGLATVLVMATLEGAVWLAAIVACTMLTEVIV